MGSRDYHLGPRRPDAWAKLGPAGHRWPDRNNALLNRANDTVDVISEEGS